MTAPIEERLRVVLRDMADEVQPSPPPVQFQQQRVTPAPWRLALVAAAVVVVVTLAVGAVALLREPRPEFTDPIRRPPKVVELGGSRTLAPGRSLIAVLPSDLRNDDPRTLHLLSSSSGTAQPLRFTGWVPYAFWQQLSWDGTRVIRQRDAGGDPRLEIVNLEDGTTNRLAGRRGYCPALSPDNRTVALLGDDDHLSLVSARDSRLLARRVAPGLAACVAIGWSPDGSMLTIPGTREQLVVDTRGRTVARLGQHRAVNGSMSWAPDAHSLLLYNGTSGEYLVKDVTGGDEMRLMPPPAAVRAMGWTGSQVVWLVGEPGDYRLVTTDRAGADPRTWMRIDAGDRVIESVQWSRDLIGEPVSDE